MHADDLRDASRERLLAEIGTLKRQYDISDQLKLTSRVRELEMALLQSRDYSMGLSAEVGELRAANALLGRNNQKLRKTIDGFYISRTWRVGKVVMLPIRIVKRFLKTK